LRLAPRLVGLKERGCYLLSFLVIGSNVIIVVYIYVYYRPIIIYKGKWEI